MKRKLEINPLKWLKLEDLLEQKRINETAMSQRGGLLSLLLHRTTTAAATSSLPSADDAHHMDTSTAQLHHTANTATDVAS